jgi:hypothetical protein
MTKYQGVKMAKNNKRTSSVSVASASKNVEFNPDYTYIKKDLARIGSLAGFFIVVLIVVSFFVK